MELLKYSAGYTVGISALLVRPLTSQVSFICGYVSFEILNRTKVAESPHDKRQDRASHW